MDTCCTTEIPRFHRGDLDLLLEGEVESILKVTKALSDSVRLQMLYLISQRVGQPKCGDDLCTCEFEELLGMSQSKVSYHLNLLLQAGLITRENRGTWSHYRLRDTNVLNQVRAITRESQVYILPE